MDEYCILTNRRRTLIALVHSVVFLLLAMHTSLSLPKAGLLYSPAHSARAVDYVMLAVYVAVTAILLQLARISGCMREKLYFAFCATSAAIGLLRLIFGDPALRGGQHLRALMLGAAIIAGYSIWRSHAPAPALEQRRTGG